MNRIISPEPQTDNGLTMWSQHPTWVKLPKQLGGAKKKVLRYFDIEYCQCGTHPTTVYELEDNYIVCKCDKNGYVFAQKK